MAHYPCESPTSQRVCQEKKTEMMEDVFQPHSSLLGTRQPANQPWMRAQRSCSIHVFATGVASDEKVNRQRTKSQHLQGLLFHPTTHNRPYFDMQPADSNALTLQALPSSHGFICICSAATLVAATTQNLTRCNDKPLRRRSVGDQLREHAPWAQTREGARAGRLSITQTWYLWCPKAVNQASWSVHDPQKWGHYLKSRDFVRMFEGSWGLQVWRSFNVISPTKGIGRSSLGAWAFT